MTWVYLHQMVDGFTFPGSHDVWNTTRMLPVHEHGRFSAVSLEDLRGSDRLVEVLDSRVVLSLGGEDYFSRKWPARLPVDLSKISHAIINRDLPQWSNHHCQQVFHGRTPTAFVWLDDVHLAIEWREGEAKKLFAEPSAFNSSGITQPNGSYICALPSVKTIAISLPRVETHHRTLLFNERNRFFQWVQKLSQIPDKEFLGEYSERVRLLIRLLIEAARGYQTDIENLQDHVQGWKKIVDPRVPKFPPGVSIDEQTFKLPSKNYRLHLEQLRNMKRMYERAMGSSPVKRRKRIPD